MHCKHILMFSCASSFVKRLSWLSVFLVFSFVCTQVHCAVSSGSEKNFSSYLIEEKNHLKADIKQLKEQVMPKDLADYAQQKSHVESMLAINQAKIKSLEGFLENQNAEQTRLTQKLKYLQQLPLTTPAKSTQEKVFAAEKSVAANKETYELVADDLELANRYQELLRDQVKLLQRWEVKFKQKQQLVAIKEARSLLLKELKPLYNNTFLEDKKVHTLTPEALSMRYQAGILLNNQHITLIQHELAELHLQRVAIRARMALMDNDFIKTLQHTTDTFASLLVQYSKLVQTAEQMRTYLASNLPVKLDAKQTNLKDQLQTRLKKLLQVTLAHQQEVSKSLSEYQIQLKKMISARQSLADYSLASWPLIAKRIAAIPSSFNKYMKNLVLKVWDSYLWLDVLPTLFLWVLLVGLCSAFFVLNLFLKSLRRDKERSRLAGYLYDGVITIVQRNIPFLCFFACLWAVFYATHIAFVTYQLLFNLLLVGFVFRVLLLIARLVLLESISDASGKDVALYYRLRWLLVFGGWATALMAFSHLLPLSLLLQDLFNRLFMAFLLCLSLVAWQSKEIIPYLLKPLLTGQKRYVINAISLLLILVPITVFSTAVIGLLGYVNLAWSMSLYQAYALMVLVMYILVRGLLFDALDLISEWMVASLRNGWLWIEVFLKPLDKILRVALLLVSVVFLFQFFGWHSDSLVVLGLEKFAHYTLINLPGIHTTVASTLAFLLLLAVFIWASKWTREFCYRWLYKSAKDVGIRNSLSVFTQYAVILTGGLIALHVLGLDFSGMSMVLGGFAVGMGFGLRDFASNIVGGIMLLIERPVREGDLITIGEYEGEVAHIGIRSMRVSSWDNTEVLIPNAETFNKPFINWTHQDNIVRTVVPIKVSRADDPVIVQQLILDVLAIIPEIVPSPPVQVFLKKIDEALIEFEARYFINVQLYTRFEVRSKVLFAITAQFKAAGVKPPVEPITVEFKEGQGDVFTKNRNTSD